MKRFLLTTLFVFISFCFVNADNKKENVKKGKMVVLTSKGGNGHMSACAVLQDIFPDYEIKLNYPIYEYFHNSFDGEAWYSSLFQSGWTGAVNFIVRYPAKLFFNFTSKTFQKRFIKMLEQEKPDILISVIPFLNYPAACAAEKLKIPFLLITLDADLTNWLLGMENCRNKDFAVTTQIKTPRVTGQFKKKKIPDSCLYEVGCPLRKDFFLPKDTDAIRKEWNIPENKKVVMLMRGGTGSAKMVDYVRTLVKLDTQVHLLVCIGRNTKIISKLKRIKNSGPVTFSIINFTPKIADLMSVSDLLITQPSPNVCNEAMHMHLPLLVDKTSSCLFWEDATIDWINILGVGCVFNRMKDLNKMVMQNLNGKKEVIDKNLCDYVPCFNTEVRNIVSRILLKK